MKAKRLLPYHSGDVRIKWISALKIGLGSALAVCIAALLKLPGPGAAGTITLLTLVVHTRKETVELIIRRLISFVITVLVSWLIFSTIHQAYIAYGLCLFTVVFIMEILGWESTLSVNAVIAYQFLVNQDFSPSYIFYEFILLAIGISIAFVFNLIQPDLSEKERLYARIRSIEKELQGVLKEISTLLVQEDACQLNHPSFPNLRQKLHDSLEEASHVAGNSLSGQDDWFMPYFEMRLEQSVLLHQMYTHLDGICLNSKHGQKALHFLNTLIEALPQADSPVGLLEQNKAIRQEIIETFDQGEDFETDSMLLLLMMDLKAFLELKERFTSSLTPAQRLAFEAKNAPAAHGKEKL